MKDYRGNSLFLEIESWKKLYPEYPIFVWHSLDPVFAELFLIKQNNNSVERSNIKEITVFMVNADYHKWKFYLSAVIIALYTSIIIIIAFFVQKWEKRFQFTVCSRVKVAYSKANKKRAKEKYCTLKIPIFKFGYGFTVLLVAITYGLAFITAVVEGIVQETYLNILFVLSCGNAFGAISLRIANAVGKIKTAWKKSVQILGISLTWSFTDHFEE